MRRIRFRLRTLLLLLLLPGALLAPFGRRLVTYTHEAQAVRQLHYFHPEGVVGFERDRWAPLSHVAEVSIDPAQMPRLYSQRPPGYIPLRPARPVTELDARLLASLPRLARLSLRGEIEAAAWPIIGSMRQLRVLDLSYSSVGDADLPALAGLTNLELLHLEATSVSEQAVRELGYALPNLELLDD